MLKVLFAPLNYGMVVQSGIYDAFREAGAQLEVFDYFYVHEQKHKDLSETRKEFLAKCLSFRPDLIHLQIQHTAILDGNIIGEVKRHLPNTIISNWTGDVRNYIPPTFMDIARFADFNLISSTGQIEKFEKAIGKKVHYWQIGYNPKLYYPASGKGRFEYDVVFIANDNKLENYPGQKDRFQICQMLRETFGDRFGLFGNNWPSVLKPQKEVQQSSVSQIYHRSICTLSISHYNDLQHYFSDRLLMCLASGRPTICFRFPHWESYFTNNCDLVIANSIEEIPAKIKWLKQNPEIAEYIGESGAAKVFAEHTYLSRIVELFDIVGLKS